MFKPNKNKILPQIKLKYHNITNEQGERPTHPDMTCGICGTIGITVAGAKESDGRALPVCENCAIDEYQRYYKFPSWEAAAASRRRIFDVQYLFNEILTDKYLADNHLSSVDDLSLEEMNSLLKASSGYYNSLFSKRKKMALEQNEDQAEIEEAFRKVLPKVKLKNFRQVKNVVFTAGQYENLIKLVYLGNWLVNAIRSGTKEEPRLEKFDNLEDYILSLAKEFDLENLVDYDKKYGYSASNKLAEGEVREYIDDYDDDCFWEELKDRLVQRDFVKMYGQEAVAKMDWQEKFKKQEPFEEKYAKEFEDYGLERLQVID